MEYFYAQCEHTYKNKFLEQFTAYSRSQETIFLDDEHDDSQWKKLSEQFESHDIVYVTEISKMSLDTIDLRDKLMIIQKKNVQLRRLDEESFFVEQLLEVVDFMMHEGLYKQKMKQREGIQKALENKKHGKGAYGRPKAKAPEDFEENIRLIMAKKMSHESYRTNLNMKRSTYFKIVKELKDSWKQKSRE